MARKPSSSSKAPAPRPRAPIGARTDRAKPKPEAKHDRAATVAKTPKGKPVPKGRAGTIALVGRPNVGKSTLFNAMIGERIAIISHHPQTTRDRIAGILTTQGTQLVFQDTPGIHQPKTKLGRRMNEVASGTAEEADVVVFVVDVPADPVAEAQRAEATREKDAAVLRGVPKDKPVVLVVNKIDRIKEKSKLLDVLTAYSALHDFAAVVPVSAKKRDGIERLRAVLGELLPEGELLYPEDDISDRPVRFFIAELVREQVLMRTREEVPHGIAVTVDAFEEPPTKASVPATAASRPAFGRTSGKRSPVTRITLSIHVAKDSHKGIIIGQGGKMLTAIGTAARERAERLLGQRVHLDIRVKATPDWFDNASRLIELGYGDDKGGHENIAPRSGPPE
jgi:GTPase